MYHEEAVYFLILFSIIIEKILYLWKIFDYGRKMERIRKV